MTTDAYNRNLTADGRRILYRLSAGGAGRRKRPRMGAAWIQHEDWTTEGETILQSGLKHNADGSFSAEVEISGSTITHDGRRLEWHKWVMVPCTEIISGKAARLARS